MLRIERLAPVLMCLAALGAAIPALAQENLDAGKTPAELFASDCSVCHKSARGLGKSTNTYSLTGFLKQHYTSSQQTAAALANYLLSGAGAGEAQRPVTASRNPPLPRERAAPDKRRARAKTEEPRKPVKDTAKPDKKPAKKKDEPKNIERAAKPAEQLSQGDRTDGDERPATGAAAGSEQLPSVPPPQQQAAVTASPSGRSAGESTGGPLRNAIPLAGRVPAMRPPPRRTDTIAD